jgi:hypothetical protein
VSDVSRRSSCLRANARAPTRSALRQMVAACGYSPVVLTDQARLRSVSGITDTPVSVDKQFTSDGIWHTRDAHKRLGT